VKGFDFSDVLALGGAGLTTAGLAMWSVPAALIFPGILLLVVGGLGIRRRIG